MFEKYRLALTSPRKSPLAPLFKGGTGLLVPLFNGDLAVRYGRGSPAHESGVFIRGFPPNKNTTRQRNKTGGSTDCKRSN